MIRVSAILAVVGLCVGCGGGGGDSTPRGTVTGTVTYKGTPVASGRIVFSPDGKGEIGIGTITSGNYSLDASVGKNTVMIEAIGPENDEGEEGNEPTAADIPKAYSVASPLTAEVKSGDNKFDFDLEDIEVEDEDGEDDGEDEE